MFIDLLKNSTYFYWDATSFVVLDDTVLRTSATYAVNGSLFASKNLRSGWLKMKINRSFLPVCNLLVNELEEIRRLEIEVF